MVASLTLQLLHCFTIGADSDGASSSLSLFRPALSMGASSVWMVPLREGMLVTRCTSRRSDSPTPPGDSPTPPGDSEEGDNVREPSPSDKGLNALLSSLLPLHSSAESNAANKREGHPTSGDLTLSLPLALALFKALLDRLRASLSPGGGAWGSP